MRTKPSLSSSTVPASTMGDGKSFRSGKGLVSTASFFHIEIKFIDYPLGEIRKREFTNGIPNNRQEKSTQVRLISTHTSMLSPLTNVYPQNYITYRFPVKPIMPSSTTNFESLYPQPFHFKRSCLKNKAKKYIWNYRQTCK